jgi:CRP-like cAMP-binding protein
MREHPNPGSLVTSKLYKKVIRAYNAGEVIFQQGDECDGIYSVQSGQVSVFKASPGPNGPVEVEIVKLGPGSMFGEMGMLDQGAKRDASVRALEYTEVLVITRDMFDSQMTALPPWVMNFIKIIISRLRVTNDKLLAAMRQLEAHGLSPEGKEKDAPAAARGPQAPANRPG